MAIAGLEIVTGGVSAPPALGVHSSLRTTTNGFPDKEVRYGQTKCGDQMLTADVTINAPVGSPAVLIVENGQLDLNGHTLTTSSGSAVTVVFSGTNGSYVHAPTDNTNGAGGALNITAPTSGPWSGALVPGS
jgi:hypothetical protein